MAGQAARTLPKMPAACLHRGKTPAKPSNRKSANGTFFVDFWHFSLVLNLLFVFKHYLIYCQFKPDCLNYVFSQINRAVFFFLHELTISAVIHTIAAFQAAWKHKTLPKIKNPLPKQGIFNIIGFFWNYSSGCSPSVSSNWPSVICTWMPAASRILASISAATAGFSFSQTRGACAEQVWQAIRQPGSSRFWQYYQN